MILSTADELNALPEGSVILDSHRHASTWTKTNDSPRVFDEGLPPGLTWASVHWRTDWLSQELVDQGFGPFYVLYRPDRPSLQAALKDLVERADKSDAQYGSVQRPETEYGSGIRYAVRKIRENFE